LNEIKKNKKKTNSVKQPYNPSESFSMNKYFNFLSKRCIRYKMNFLCYLDGKEVERRNNRKTNRVGKKDKSSCEKFANL